MGRKWQCNGTAGCPRGPPGLFPAVCPCEAGCADFPAMWQPCPTQAPETALSRPVRRVCGEGWKMPDRRNEGRMGKRKRCGIKRGGRTAPPARFTPSRNAGRDSGLRGFSPGVNAGVRFESRGSSLPPRGRNCPSSPDF